MTDKSQIETLLEERRYFLSKMFQAVAIYFALIGFSIKEMMSTNNLKMVVIIAMALTITQCFAFYVGILFNKIINTLSSNINGLNTDFICNSSKYVKLGTRTIFPLIIVIEFLILGITILSFH